MIGIYLMYKLATDFNYNFDDIITDKIMFRENLKIISNYI